MPDINRNRISFSKETKDIALKVSNIIGKLEFADENDKEFSLSSYINYLLKAAENSDQKLRAEIENNLVRLGAKAVPYLLDSLMTIKGCSRGIAAMTIIRIGKSSMEFLGVFAKENPRFAWMAEYIINEIQGTQVSVGHQKAEFFVRV
jgi:hypothetical protein